MGTIYEGPDNVQKDFLGYRVSFKSSISRMVRNPHILKYIGADLRSYDGVMRDECDGTNCQFHPVIGQHPRAIKVRLYYDDVEVTNPLSSKTHTLGQ